MPTKKVIYLINFISKMRASWAIYMLKADIKHVLKSGLCCVKAFGPLSLSIFNVRLKRTENGF